MLCMIVRIFCALVGVFASSNAVASAKESSLIYVGPDNFTSIVGSSAYDVVLIDFFAPWCGHCKRLEPELIDAYSRLRELKIRVLIAKVDAEANSGLKRQEGVNGFPTLKVYKEGEFIEDYKGARFADQIANYLKKQVHPLVANVPGDGLNKFVYESSLEVVRCVFVHFSTGDEADEAAVSAIADKHSSQLWFGQVKGKHTNELGEERATPERSTLVAFDPVAAKGKGRVGILKGPFDMEELDVFVETNMWVTVMPISQATFPQAVGSPRPVVMLLIEDHWDSSKEAKSFLAQATPVALKRRKEYLFTSVDATLLGQWLTAEFRIAPVFPSVVIYQNNRTLFFHSDDWREMGKTVASSLNAFINAYEEGHIIPQVLGTASYWNKAIAYARLYPPLAATFIAFVLILLYGLYAVLFSDMAPEMPPDQMAQKKGT